MKRLLLVLSASMLLLCVACKPKTIADIPSQYVTLEDGAKVHYKVCGSGGITLLFVHGFGCDVNVWEKQYEAFRHDTIRMVFVDLPGYGQSDKPETAYTLDYFADAVKAVIDQLQLRRVVLVGHSLGTPVCRQVVFKYPEVSAALCDIDGVYCFYTDDADSANYRHQINDFVEMFHGESYKQNIIDFVSTLSGPFTPEWVTTYALSTMPRTEENVAYSTMSNLVNKDYWTGEKINIPTLILCTRNSGLDADNKHKMDELYNDATYVELANTGHFIMMEDAGIFNNLLERSYEKWKVTEL
ncbi:MAG: alpha/beta hydrolase [Bacteroidales bacterium]|nr:alpha/beta hydrolase [Candidatus Colimorpha pelethequi]